MTKQIVKVQRDFIGVLYLVTNREGTLRQQGSWSELAPRFHLSPGTKGFYRASQDREGRLQLDPVQLEDQGW